MKGIQLGEQFNEEHNGTDRRETAPGKKMKEGWSFTRRKNIMVKSRWQESMDVRGGGTWREDSFRP